MVHLDDTLHRDDIPSMPQAYWLFRSQTLITLLHYLTGNNYTLTHTASSYKTSFFPIIYPLNLSHTYLSEVTLLNEDCFGERNHMATLTLIHREVQNTNLSLRGKNRFRLQ